MDRLVHLLAVDIGLNESRVAWMRSNFGFDGAEYVFLTAPKFRRGGYGRVQVGHVGSDRHRDPMVSESSGGEQALVIHRQDQILRRHQGLVGVVHRWLQSVHFLHEEGTQGYLHSYV